MRFQGLVVSALLIATVSSAAIVRAQTRGYYRYPAVHRNTVIFTAEGDLWSVDIEGGAAHRLTTHPDEESHAAISPDGSTIAFRASYEGPAEVYAMAITGGVPRRVSYTGGRLGEITFAPNGRILYATSRYSTLPNWQLMTYDPHSGTEDLLPLAQGAEGSFADDGTLFFSRLGKQGSHTKRYQGGTAQRIWSFKEGDWEATLLTPDYPGTSRFPMWYAERVYFISDRDGSMNIWSMNSEGAELQQHTFHDGWDVKDPALGSGQIVYQLGADLRLYDIETDSDRQLEIRLSSDFDQARQKWVTDPMSYLTAANMGPDAERLALTARGEVFVASSNHDRIIQLTRDSDVRYRLAQFMPDGEDVLVLSDESGELEFWLLPADGEGERRQLTNDGTVFRAGAAPSPDGKWIAYHDKNWELHLLDVATGESRRLAGSEWGEFASLTWSPDSRLLAYVEEAANTNPQIKLYDVESEQIILVTNDYVRSYSPTFTTDGTWLYFISDRHFRSLVGSPWGPFQPDPHFDKLSKIYCVSLTGAERSSFREDDELSLAADETDDVKAEEGESSEDTDDPEEDPSEVAESPEQEDEPIVYELSDLTQRSIEVPIAPGNYSNLSASDDRLYYVSSERPGNSRDLVTFPIDNEDPELKTLVSGVQSYQLSSNGKKLMVRKDNRFNIVKAGASLDLKKGRVELRNWKFSMEPREEWRQMFIEAWRLERDYFYDRDMHGVTWTSVLETYLPLVDRVTTRAELNDLIGQMISELSALHMTTFGGDQRSGGQDVNQGFLGARLTRDHESGGYRIEHIYTPDPNYPERRSPLAQPGSRITRGDVITHLNGDSVLEAANIGALLRDQVGRPVRVALLDANGEPFEEIVTPISGGAARNVRYSEWEYTRRQRVDQVGEGKLGYLHLRAMGGRDIGQFAREFYPVFNRHGLIIDVRHNGGGNIDSWILSKLMRKAWMYWQGVVGSPTWNMQYAFRGHMVVLCDEWTGSDGEAFSEGFRRLGLGKVIGTRTWGGEIWLSYNTPLVDRGMASAAEWGVYGPEGEWLIEGWGVEPDIVVDNLPHATFNGEDAQLEAAIAYLLRKIEEEPVDVPPPPPHPDKSHPSNR